MIRGSQKGKIRSVKQALGGKFMRRGKLSFICYSLVLALAFAARLPAAETDKDVSKGAATTSLSEEINRLEANLGINPAREGAQEERIAALEYRLLGKTESGSLVSRIERLKRIEGQGRAGTRSAKLGAAVPIYQFKAADADVGKVLELLPLPNTFNANYVRMQPPGAKIDLNSNYLAEVMRATKGKVVRFRQMPIPVYIAPAPDPSLARACVHGFETWEERSGGIVRFVQIDEPERARIKVVWGHLGVSSNPQDCSMGAHTVTKWQANGTKRIDFNKLSAPFLKGGGKYAVPPQVIEVNLDLIYSKSEEIRMLLLQNVVAHELGHALGILSHSPDRGDLMFAVTDECSRISQRDLNTLKRIYDAKLDVAL